MTSGASLIENPPGCMGDLQINWQDALTIDVLDESPPGLQRLRFLFRAGAKCFGDSTLDFRRRHHGKEKEIG
ncbi:MAG: hypothetical protein K0S06_2803 [Microvirga sp.]|nr:hypothetical protein [Microvirga sp.]